MIQIRSNQQKKSKKLFQQAQIDCIKHLQSLLPKSFSESELKKDKSGSDADSRISQFDFFNSKSIRNFNRSTQNLTKSRLVISTNKKNQSDLGQFLLKLVKKIAAQKWIDQFGQFQPISKQLGFSINEVNKIQAECDKITYLLAQIDKSIEDQKKKILFGSKNYSHSNVQFNNINNSIQQPQQKPCSLAIPLGNQQSYGKQNNFSSNKQIAERVPSKYQSFLKEQNKKDVDDFAWLDIKIKYPMLEKKLKSKLIQSINQNSNQKRIRQLISKKQTFKRSFNHSTTKQTHNSPSMKSSTSYIFSNSVKNKSNFLNNAAFIKQGPNYDIEDEKIDLVNESLFMQEFQKAKIDYVWTEEDEKIFVKNINNLKQKCSKNSQFLKLCGRFKFISQGEFQTLACEQISRMLNKNNKIYLSRQFLLDKYYSTTQVLTEQQMRFILKTSPMLSKCVDKNFIKTAIKNIRYENISDLQLKIAEDIISRFEKLRNSVRASRQGYKQEANKITKERIAFFDKNRQFSIARQIAQQQLKNHKRNLVRSLNYDNKKPQQSVSNKGLTKKKTKNIWTPLNKYHPSTGLFVKDCNQQCTDDLFNPYERSYLKKIETTKHVPNKNISNQIQMIKFYSGGPDENIGTSFNARQQDIKNICSVIKAYFFQKRILAVLPTIQLSVDQQLQNKQDIKINIIDTRTRKTFAPPQQEDLEQMAKKKLLENRQRAKQTVYVSKLLFLAAQNAFQSLKALNPHFSPQQINTRDRKGNTALFYACKNMNDEFVDFLMRFGANPNVKCQKQESPLHLGFKSSNLSLILKLLSSSFYSPDLNLLNSQFKTPLAYCSREILQKLNLQQGVTTVDPNNSTMIFDNNTLLQMDQFDKIKQDSLQVVGQFAKRVKQNKNLRKQNQVLTSIKDMNI